MAPLTSTVIVTHNLLIVYMIDESEFLNCSINLEAGLCFYQQWQAAHRRYKFNINGGSLQVADHA